jgi:lysophospholipase L1-like esterase
MLPLFLALISLPLHGGSPQPATFHRLVCLGDSITQMGEAPGGYVSLLREWLAKAVPGSEVINAGISGNTSRDMLARFQKDVLDKKPDLITISVGVNDVWHGFDVAHPNGGGPGGVSLPEYQKNVESMVSQAQAKGVKVVLLAATVIYEDLSNAQNAMGTQYNAALRRIAAGRHASFIDLQLPFRTLIHDYRLTTGARDNLLTTDGVHMNVTGNLVMAHAILNGLGI